jgi:hypothetical protein
VADSVGSDRGRHHFIAVPHICAIGHGGTDTVRGGSGRCALVKSGRAAVEKSLSERGTRRLEIATCRRASEYGFNPNVHCVRLALSRGELCARDGLILFISACDARFAICEAGSGVTSVHIKLCSLSLFRFPRSLPSDTSAAHRSPTMQSGQSSKYCMRHTSCLQQASIPRRPRLRQHSYCKACRCGHVSFQPPEPGTRSQDRRQTPERKTLLVVGKCRRSHKFDPPHNPSHVKREYYRATDAV